MPCPGSSAGPFTLGLGTGLDAVLGLTALQRMYETLPPGDFPGRALERLGVHVEARGLECVPADGPTVVVVNHPTGALDGLAMLVALRRRRPDVRVVANHLLTRIPEMRARAIPVDAFRPGAAASSRGLRQARRWLERGGALVLFPAGAVARRVDGDGMAVDSPWREGVLRLVGWTGAAVVPAHLGGRPSQCFRALSRIHRALGTLLLPRELLRQTGTRVSVRFGTRVESSRLDALPSPAARLAYLRARVHALSPAPRAVRVEAPLAPTVIPSLLKREIEGLPDECRLTSIRDLAVFHAKADRIPHTLREIGRLRERTFRAAGEGTGRAIDLDAFDERYTHLVLWNRARSEVVGAYRMGVAGDRHEAPPLYTETLFDWRRRPGASLGPSMELGRSFVREEYQREPAALLMLWKGIGAIVARRPGVRHLFGPVSISADYHSLTRELITAWLLRHAAAPAAVAVKPRHPVRCRPEVRMLVDSGAVTTLGDLDEVVRELEGGRGLPVLLRQYLRLNGRVLALSRDPDFGDVIDALVVVDMLEMPAAHLERYCGAEGAARIRAAHRPSEPSEERTAAGVAPVPAMASSR
ncbi:MAG: lysophospholipid acyltransferase family protein [Acidobacteria bacterium]|nr:lysophospholipid acyltransferase family protein [Acidobacteriota bacterium]